MKDLKVKTQGLPLDMVVIPAAADPTGVKLAAPGGGTSHTMAIYWALLTVLCLILLFKCFCSRLRTNDYKKVKENRGCPGGCEVEYQGNKVVTSKLGVSNFDTYKCKKCLKVTVTQSDK